jgi:Flp pilus assembly protein TadG
MYRLISTVVSNFTILRKRFEHNSGQTGISELEDTNMIASRFGEFFSSRTGSVAIIFAFAAIPIAAFVGSAVDYGTALRAKTQLQTVVDVAAAAGARLPATSNANRTSAVLNSYNANVSTTTVANSTPVIDATNAKVTVTASAEVPTHFMGIIGVDTITVTAKAVARSQIENGGVACVLSLNTSSPDGFHLQGKNAVSSDNCWAWVNSADATAINANGASSGTAQGFCTAGSVVGPEHFSPPPYTGCSPMDDPFYTKFENYNPTSTACDHQDVELSSGSFTLNPGVYCGNTVFKPQADVTLNPGTYIFRDGYLQVQAGASLTGDGVTLFFYGQNTMMEIRGGADVDLKAPATGDLAGFVIVDRKFDWYDPAIRESIIQGGGSVTIEGILYAPQWKVTISGNSDINQNAKFFTMIADTIYMEGNGKMHIKSDAAGAGLPDLMPKIKNGPVILE